MARAAGLREPGQNPMKAAPDQSAPGDFYYWVTRTQSYLAAPTPLP